ncbi:copper resistance CopC family protein [Microbacterium sp. gxy059]|uniref:copper resistance CopC family protein n=1 Tax=Microbacterium sp. gxy059 TaxID=2957199 RepID=UPI003D98A868
MTDRSALRRRRGPALAALAVAFLAALAGPASPASAHSTLIGTSPETEGVVESLPSEVSLTFSEDLIAPTAPGDGTTDVVVYDATCEDAALLVANPGEADTRECRDYASGDPVVAGPVVTQAIDASDAPAGEYTVIWRVLYADGHADSQLFVFTAEQGVSAAEAEDADAGEDQAEAPDADGSGASAEQGDDDPRSDASDETSASEAPADEAQDEAGDATPWLIGGAVVVVALVAIGIAWRTIRRRRGSDG